MKKLRIFQTELRVYEMLLYGNRKQKKKIFPDSYHQKFKN